MLAGKRLAFLGGCRGGRSVLAAAMAVALASAPVAAAPAECPSPRQLDIPQPSRPLNLGLIKKQLRDYHDTAYPRDLADILADARSFVEQRAGEVSKPALVLDIDETALSNWPTIQANDFGYIAAGSCDRLPKGPCGFRTWERKHAAAAIAPTLALFNAAKAKRVEVFFITGRHADTREATIRNLRTVGYRRWNALFTRVAGDTRRPVTDYKSEARAKIEARGFTIIANVGDQDSDLAGGHAECAFKLPNPFYFIP